MNGDVTLNVAMPSNIRLSVIILSVIMLSVNMVSIIILNATGKVSVC
jgi:hypothetical protein